MKRLVTISLLAFILLSTLCGCKEKVCEACGDTYKGKSHTITLFGETGEVCKDCHQEYLELIGAK